MKLLHVATVVVFSILTLLLLIFQWPIGLIFLAISIYWLVKSINEKIVLKKLTGLGKPASARPVKYMRGYDRGIKGQLYYWIEQNTLKLIGLDATKKDAAIRIDIPKDNIRGYTSSGSLTTTTTSHTEYRNGKHKVIKDSHTSDTRKTILLYTENGVEKSLILGPSIFADLCVLCMEKKVS